MTSRDPARPNLLLVFADDLATWAVGSYGSPDAHTPTLDCLADRGCRMENFFCTSPVCSPARASLLSGKIPSQHGVHDWIRAGNAGPDGVDFLAGHRSLPDFLAEAGYRCGLAGKWHLGASDQPRPGFDFWYAYEKGGGVYYEAPMYRGSELEKPERYLSDVLAEEAIAFVESSDADDRPFYLNLSFTAPHYPWVDAHPAELLELYEGCAFESVPREPIHPWLLQQNPETYAAVRDPEASLRGYFAATSGLDRALGAVVDAIEAAGLSSSTLIAFVGDNGFNAGHHGIWGKGNGTWPQNMYDTSVRVPAFFVQPGRIPAGFTSENLLSGYDLLPTVVDYLGLADESRADGALPGRSFRDLLETGGGDADDGPIVVYDEYGPVRMIRTAGWKLVERYPDGPDELFDLESDPDERVNLFEVPAHAAVVAELTARLRNWFVRYVHPAFDGRALPVTGLGQCARLDQGSPRSAFVQPGPPGTIPVLE